MTAALRSRWLVLALLGVATCGGLASASPTGSGLALLAVTGIPAAFAVPPRGRLFLGLTLVLITGLAVVAGVPGDAAPLVWTAVVGLVGAGGLTTRYGRGWATSAGRFGRATSAPADDRVDLWRDLDRGIDPTVHEVRDSADPPRAC